MGAQTKEEPRWAVEVASLWPPQGQWTEQDYFNLPDSNRLIELSEGEVFILPPPSYEHQHTLGNFYTILTTFVRQNNLGLTVFAPLAVRLWPGKIREPDVMFYSEAHRDRLGGTVSGVPDMVAEVVSPGSRKADRHDKFYEYAQAGIGEYWLIEPEKETVEIFALVDGVYELVVQAGAGQVAQSRLLAGFEVEVTAVFA